MIDFVLIIIIIEFELSIKCLIDKFKLFHNFFVLILSFLNNEFILLLHVKLTILIFHEDSAIPRLVVVLLFEHLNIDLI